MAGGGNWSLSLATQFPETVQIIRSESFQWFETRTHGSEVPPQFQFPETVQIIRSESFQRFETRTHDSEVPPWFDWIPSLSTRSVFKNEKAGTASGAPGNGPGRRNQHVTASAPASGHGQGRRNQQLSAEHSMRITVGYGGPVHDQARKRLWWKPWFLYMTCISLSGCVDWMISCAYDFNALQQFKLLVTGTVAARVNRDSLTGRVSQTCQCEVNCDSDLPGLSWCDSKPISRGI